MLSSDMEYTSSAPFKCYDLDKYTTEQSQESRAMYLQGISL
jgi:hypothetical protein